MDDEGLVNVEYTPHDSGERAVLEASEHGGGPVFVEVAAGAFIVAVCPMTG